MPVSFGFAPRFGLVPGFTRGGSGGGGTTTLVREPDGTVTITSLGPTWSPNTTREADGTVTVGA